MQWPAPREVLEKTIMSEDEASWNEEYESYLKQRRRNRNIGLLICIFPLLLLGSLALLPSNAPVDPRIGLLLIAGVVGGAVVGFVLVGINDLLLKSVERGTAIISQIAEPRFDFNGNLVYAIYDDVVIVARKAALFFAAFTGYSQLAEKQSFNIQTSLRPDLKDVTIEHLTFLRIQTNCRLPTQDGRYFEGEAVVYQLVIARSSVQALSALSPSHTLSRTHNIEGKDLMLKVIEHIKNDVRYGET